ncbi:MAG: metal-dependent transcriptional regulator [Candidatus Poseidoniaceae archaeon]|nr:metal-dependent transcriptional regulator [Candidatus Poseidoniaceae archaeon]|tara:strand:+ start:5316 stop:5987 length:672 start_codon:yes stop_codon:yes gene_type:complete
MNGHFREFEDEYLETMYEFFEKQPSIRVRNGDLAKSLDVSPASATEMIQRLAGKDLVDYVPYKGALLTEKGMIHGQKMKRRHRLAEVFLETISFQGNTHATACRLEHAIDDDLEVALSLLLGQPQLDPSGRDIPEASTDISLRIHSSRTQLISLECLEDGITGTLEAMFTNALETDTMAQSGVQIGSKITRAANGYSIAGSGDAIFSSDLASKILVRISLTDD